MPLLKADKKALAKTYLQEVQQAKNIVVLTQTGIPVNEGNALRIALEDAQGKLQVVKKRVFLQGVQAEMLGATLDELAWSIAVLYSYNETDEHAPLKVINTHKKKWIKEKRKFGMEYVGGWYTKAWQQAGYVTELANLPSKEELVGKFLFLLNHPVSGFARVLQAIADKQWAPEATPVAAVTEAPAPVAAVVEETPAEAAPSEAPVDESVAPSEETSA